MKTNIIQAQQLSIWDIWQDMLMESGDLLSKYQIINILLLHPPIHWHLAETQFESVIALTQASMRPCIVISSLPETQILQLLQKIFPKLKQREELNICATNWISVQPKVQSKPFSTHFKNVTGNLALKWTPRITSMPFVCTPKFCAVDKTYNAVLVMDWVFLFSLCCERTGHIMTCVESINFTNKGCHICRALYVLALHVFSNCPLKNLFMYLAIFVVYCAKPFFSS